MRPVYAVQFQIQPSTSALSTFQEVCAVVSSWVRRWYKEWRQVDLALTTEGADTTPLDGHRIEISDATTSEGLRLWSLSWSYPADSDERLLWRSECTVALAENEIELAFVLRIGSRDFTIAPTMFDVRRPYVVKNILERFPCRLGNRPLRSAPSPIALDDVVPLGGWLRSSERRVPVVIFSRDPYSERCLASPVRAADTLAGLAEVVVLNDKWTSFRLTDEVGKPLSCFNGAIRVYWPSTAGDLRADRPFMPDELEELGDGVVDRLLRRIAPVSAFRFAEMGTIRAVRAALDRDRQRQLQALRDGSVSGAEKFEWLVNENASLTEQKQRAERELDDVRLRILELEDEVAQLKENMLAITTHTAPAPRPAPRTPPPPPDPKTVREALDLAGRSFGAFLEVWPSAEESADESDFGRPAEAYQALWAIREIAEKYFASRKNGESIGRWEDLFAQKGFKYSPTEHETTLSMYGHERDFSRDGEKRRMLKHLTLGGGDKKNCLQIYFDNDDARQRFLIGHCGRHLRTNKYSG